MPEKSRPRQALERFLHPSREKQILVDEVQYFWETLAGNFQRLSLYDLLSPIGEIRGEAISDDCNFVRARYYGQSLRVEGFRILPPANSNDPVNMRELIRDDSPHKELVKAVDAYSKIAIDAVGGHLVATVTNRGLLDNLILNLHPEDLRLHKQGQVINSERTIYIPLFASPERNKRLSPKLKQTDIAYVIQALIFSFHVYDSVNIEEHEADERILKPVPLIKARGVVSYLTSPEKIQLREKALGQVEKVEQMQRLKDELNDLKEFLNLPKTKDVLEEEARINLRFQIWMDKYKEPSVDEQKIQETLTDLLLKKLPLAEIHAKQLRVKQLASSLKPIPVPAEEDITRFKGEEKRIQDAVWKMEELRKLTA